MTYSNEVVLQRLAQQNYGRDLNGAARVASGLNLDLNGICYSLFGKEQGASFDELVSLLGSGLVMVGTGSASAPDSAALSITSDIDIRVLVELTDWTPATIETLASKFNTVGDQRSWQFVVMTTGELRFTWSPGGVAVASLTSSAPTGIANGASRWVRVAFDANNGAAGRTAKFYTSPAGTQSWTQLGTDAVSATATTILDSTADLTVGGATTGSIQKLEVLNGIDGTLVADPDFRYVKPGTTSVTDSFGNVFTVSGATVGV